MLRATVDSAGRAASGRLLASRVKRRPRKIPETIGAPATFRACVSSSTSGERAALLELFACRAIAYFSLKARIRSLYAPLSRE